MSLLLRFFRWRQLLNFQDAAECVVERRTAGDAQRSLHGISGNLHGRAEAKAKHQPFIGEVNGRHRELAADRSGDGFFRAAEHEARDQRKAFLCEQDSRHNPQSREPDGEAGHDGNLRNLIRKRIQCFPQIAFLMNFSGNPSIHRIRNAGEHKQPRSPQGLIQPQINPKEQRHHTQSEKR